MLGVWLAAIGAHVQIHAPPSCDVTPLSSLGARDDVVITATISDSFRGTIALNVDDRSYPAREVTADRCEEVAEALAVIASLAIDHLPPRVEAVSEPMGPIAPEITTRTPIYPLGLEPTWHVSIGVHGAATYGHTPSFAGSAPAYLELARDPLSLRATFLWSYRPTSALTVTHLAARFDACPFHLVAGPTELDPCASLEVGAIRGVAEAASTGFWLAPGLTARGRWRFAHPFFLELEVASAVPLLRPKFLLLPDRTLWEAPRATFSAGLGLGVTVW